MKILGILKTIIFGLLITALVFVGGSLVLSRFDTPVPFKLYAVESGSMSPAVPVGSVVVVLPKDSYEAGQVITFKLDSRSVPITHRITQVATDPNASMTQYRTKGDANDDEDRTLVSNDQVIGAVQLVVPLAGYPIAFAQTQLGFILLIVVPATILIYTELVSIKDEIRRMIAGRKKKKASPAVINVKERNSE
jgi:signal peptidase